MTKNIRKQMNKALNRECYTYVINKGDGYVVAKTPTHFLLYLKPKRNYPYQDRYHNELAIVMTFDIQRKKLQLVRGEYVDTYVYSEFVRFLEFNEFLYNIPMVRLGAEGKTVTGTSHGHSEFKYGETPLPTRIIYYAGWSSNRFVFMKYPNPDGSETEEWRNNKFAAKNGVITKFEGQYIYGYVPWFLKPPHSGDYWKLPNGVKCNFQPNKWRNEWYLTKEKFVGRGTHRWQWRDTDKEFFDKVVSYPIDDNGNVLKNMEDFWCDYNLNMTNIIRWICEEGMGVPEDFNLDKTEFHFYGKAFDRWDLQEFIDNYHECNCERCRMYDKWKTHTGKYLRFRGWGEQYYKAKHLLFKDTLPTVEDQLFDCNCKACKQLRRTKNTKSYMFRDMFRGAFNKKHYPEDVVTYITADWTADIKIRPKEIPEFTGKDDMHINMDDFPLSPSMVKFQENFWSDGWRNYPLKLHKEWYRMVTRIKLGTLHARLNGIPYDKVAEEVNRWFTEVWNKFFEPDCNCKLCKSLKNAIDLNIDIINELWLEKIPSESYPIELVQAHFSGRNNGGRGYYSHSYRHNKDEVVKFLKEKVMMGVYCDCDKCKNMREIAENAKYIPNSEKLNPICPSCGGRVHNKRLVYENALVAKKIAEMQLKDMLEVKSAFCCSCYYKRMMEEKRKKYLISEAKAGDIVYIIDEDHDWGSADDFSKTPTTIKTNKETGNLEVNGMDIYEFIAEPINFTFTKKVEEYLKTGKR